jgi:sugar phosphate isomerase/epimerase
MTCFLKREGAREDGHEHMQIGLQLWTVRHEAARNFEDSLRQVAAVGYRAVEFAGYSGWSATELKGLLEELRLQPVSSHVPWERLTAHLEDELAYAEALGLQYLVCPALPEAVRQDLGQAIATLERIGAACRERNITFGYHNHAFELNYRLADGRTLLDALLEGSDPACLTAEFDVYWLRYGGADPVAYVRRYAGRVPLLHIKDMEERDGMRRDTEVGAGILPLSAIVEAAAQAQTAWLFVEQEDFEDSPWPRIAKSLHSLKAVLGEEVTG